MERLLHIEKYEVASPHIPVITSRYVSTISGTPFTPTDKMEITLVTLHTPGSVSISNCMHKIADTVGKQHTNDIHDTQREIHTSTYLNTKHKRQRVIQSVLCFEPGLSTQ